MLNIKRTDVTWKFQMVSIGVDFCDDLQSTNFLRLQLIIVTYRKSILGEDSLYNRQRQISQNIPFDLVSPCILGTSPAICVASFDEFAAIRP